MLKGKKLEKKLYKVLKAKTKKLVDFLKIMFSE